MFRDFNCQKFYIKINVYVTKAKFLNQIYKLNLMQSSLLLLENALNLVQKHKKKIHFISFCYEYIKNALNSMKFFTDNYYYCL